MKENRQISVIELESIENLYVCGDIHGEFAELITNIERYGIQNSAVILLGDCGFGFHNPGYYPHIYNKKLKKKLDKYNNIILCIRGNHDDPRYYDDPEFIPDLPRIKTLPSNTLLKVLGYNILCIGGAISIDRVDRIEDDKKRPNLKHPLSYWENERIDYIEDIESINCRVDIVLSHTAPISYDPPLFRDSKMDEELWEDILESRNYLEKINSGIKPKRWYYGHFHNSYSGSTGCTVWRCLSELEILEIPEKEKEILGKLDEN